jgi:glycosyltransferase involved in cell wall biosynthesis
VADLAFEVLPERFDRGFRIYARRVHRAAARGAGAVICVSETTAADVRSIWGIPPDRVVVARHGPGQDLPDVGEPGEPPSHFLYVGDDEPRKNLAVLLAGYGAYRDRVGTPLDLVLAGSAFSDAAGVRLESRPGPARLAELYRGAAALVHPSLHEGFGLTPLEAMRAGAPVLAARSPGIAEICGDAVRYVDPYDPEAFAVAMAEFAADAGLRSTLRARGWARVTEFSWLKSARAHVDAYSLALGL